MHYARPAYKRTDKAHHEIDGVIGGKNAQVAHAGPERVPGGQRGALLQVVFVGEYAALGAPTRSRRVDDAGDIFALALDENGLTLAVEVFPAISAAQVRAQRRLG